MALPDIVLHLDSIVVVDSLGSRDKPTGKELFDNVLSPKTVAQPSFLSRHLYALDRVAFLEALTQVARMAASGRTPILHIESHGRPEGILLASQEIITWSELAELFRAINELTKFNLLVVMAMCHGRLLAKAMTLGKPSPVWGLIGPAVPVGQDSLYRGMSAHYSAMLANLSGTVDLDGTAALAALNAAQGDPHWEYIIINAELFFIVGCELFGLIRTSVR